MKSINKVVTDVLESSHSPITSLAVYTRQRKEKFSHDEVLDELERMCCTKEAVKTVCRHNNELRIIYFLASKVKTA